MSDLSEPWTRHLAVTALAVSLVAPTLARSADPEVEALQQRVDELTHSMQELQAQVRALQGDHGAAPAPAPVQAKTPDSGTTEAAASARAAGSPGAPAPAQPATSNKVVQPPVTAQRAPAAASTPQMSTAASELAALKHAWKQVRAGGSSEDVRSLLGPPTHELNINNKLAWYYVYPGIGAGSVFFSDSGKVSSSRSPVFGFGW